MSKSLINLVRFHVDDERSLSTAIVKAIQDPSKRLYGAEFFKNEYETDNFIAKMRKPVVAIMDGITSEFRHWVLTMKWREPTL